MAVARRRSSRWRELEPTVRLLSATVLVGAVCGAVIGGLGSRLAMRILFLTSDETVDGLTSDDGFEIGRFSLGDTIGLVVTTTLLGVIAALLYLVARPFVDRLGRATVPATAVFYGVVGGAMLVHTDGVDFTVLEPALLAIVLFVAIAAAFGAAVAHLVGRAAAPDGWPRTASWWLLGPPLIVCLLPPLPVAALAAVAVNQADAVATSENRWWLAVRVGAALVIGGLFVLGAVDLVRDTAQLT